jgi:hypothetical protein
MTDTAELSIKEDRSLLDEVFDDQVVGWTAEAKPASGFRAN